MKNSVSQDVGRSKVDQEKPSPDDLCGIDGVGSRYVHVGVVQHRHSFYSNSRHCSVRSQRGTEKENLVS